MPEPSRNWARWSWDGVPEADQRGSGIASLLAAAVLILCADPLAEWIVGLWGR